MVEYNLPRFSYQMKLMWTSKVVRILLLKPLHAETKHFNEIYLKLFNQCLYFLL